MDIARPDQARKKRQRRMVYGAVGLLALAGITMGLQQLKPAAPSLARGSYWPDTVKRGTFPRTVRGNGALIPEEIRWIPAASSGRIEKICAQVGQRVEPETILVVLTDPVLEQTAFDAEWQLKGAIAELENTKAVLESQRLNQEALTASVKSDYSVALVDAEADSTLAQDGLVSRITAKRSEAKAQELAFRYEIEKKRLENVGTANRAQLAVQEARVEQMRASLQLKKQQVAALKVRAGIAGILQRLGDASPLQEGQQVPQGANLARVANPAKLKAEVRVSETQIRDVAFGQSAEVDTRNGFIQGHVVRIDPAAQNSTVTVDIALDGPLPRGARPDLTVDATIELEKLENVLHMARPVMGQPESKVSLFKIVEGGRAAIRVPVVLGRGSVTAVEVVSGLAEGDQVILSDLSALDSHDRIRLE